jgi:hypothetical protein
MVKCANCGETIFISPGGFSGIPKKKFCLKCWQRIDTIWSAEQFKKEDHKLVEWSLMIKVDFI